MCGGGVARERKQNCAWSASPENTQIWTDSGPDLGIPSTLACRGAGSGGFEPRLLRVEGIPEEAHEFWRADPGTYGWAAACADGFVKQEGHRGCSVARPMAERPAWYCRFKTATSWLRRFCAVFSTTGWHRFAVDDVFKPGARSVMTSCSPANGGLPLGSEGKLT